MPAPAPGAPTGLQILTLVIAILALLVSATTLTWHYLSWKLSGGRPKPILMLGYLGRGGAVSIEAHQAKPGWEMKVREQGFHTPVIGVKVINDGRLPITVSSWAIGHSYGINYVPVGNTIGPDLPYRLEAGDSETWFTPCTNAHALVHASEALDRNTPVMLHGEVSVGAGRTYKTKRVRPTVLPADRSQQGS